MYAGRCGVGFSRTLLPSTPFLNSTYQLSDITSTSILPKFHQRSATTSSQSFTQLFSQPKRNFAPLNQFSSTNPSSKNDFFQPSKRLIYSKHSSQLLFAQQLPLRTTLRQYSTKFPSQLSNYKSSTRDQIPFSTRTSLSHRHLLPQPGRPTQSIFHQSRRFAKLDFSRYYFFARNRKMNFLLTRRGLIRPGRKHNYQHSQPQRHIRRIWKFLATVEWPRRLKQAFLIIWYWYLFLYLLPWFLRWQYDINPRTLTRFSRLDFEERWEHQIMTDLRLYRHFAHMRGEPGSPEPAVAMNALTTPMKKPFREGLMYYYFMLIIFPFTSGMLDPLLYPRLFFFGLEPYIPEEYQDPRLPTNPLITMSTRKLLQFLSIVQSRMYLATQSRFYQNNDLQSQHSVYDTRNELNEYKLRAKRFQYNADMLNKTYEMIVHEIFRRTHSAVFYSGREAVLPAPKYIPSIPRYELNHQELLSSTIRSDEDDPESLHFDQFQGEIPGLYDQLLVDLRKSGNVDYQYNSKTKFNSVGYFYHRFQRLVSSSFVARELWTITRELANIAHVIFDRLTWTGAKTGLETIKGIDITVTSRDTAVFDYRLHDFQRPNYPLFFTTLKKQFHRLDQIIYSLVVQFRDSHKLDPNILDKFQYPILNLNSDVDEIIHFMTQPELNQHYIRMLRSLAEIDHSSTDGANYDYRRINLGVLNDRKFKLKQNIVIVQSAIDSIQRDLDVAKAITVRDGEKLTSKQLGCEWVLYELKLQHLQMRRILRDIEYFLQSDRANMIDENIEPCRGDKNPISLALNLVPFQLGNIPKNVLRRMGFIENGSIPLHGE